MNLFTKIKEKIMQLLKIQPAPVQQLFITEELTVDNNILKNRITYRGNASEINQFFSQIENTTNRFWCTYHDKIRKIHLNYIASTIDTYTNIISSDLNSIKIDDEQTQTLFDTISDENKLNKVIEKAVKECLTVGDGAFKISYDTDISVYPIIEFIPADFVDYEYHRGRLKEVVFYTDICENRKRYRLAEIYGYGYIDYRLYDEYGNLLSLDVTEYSSNLQKMTFDNQIIMAIPFKIFESTMYPNRGKALFDNKTEEFDALDEVASQWLDSVRKGRVKHYVPESLIPRNPETGSLIYNGFDFKDDFVKVAGSMEEGKDVIQTIQPSIDYSAYENSFKTFLDMLLQGVISPATLGIDLAKNTSAESQREKEKVTLFTRQKITTELTIVLKQLVQLILDVYNIANNKARKEYDISISFGEYATTSFDSVVDTVSKAHQAGIMSIEQCVEELYGDSLTDEEKQEEIQRIKDEMGIEELDPSLVGDSEEEIEEIKAELGEEAELTSDNPTVKIDGEKIKELTEQLGRKELKAIYNELP